MDIPPNGPVGIFGYSQGGGASAAAAELQGAYAPGLDVVGSYAGAVPAGLAALAKSAESNALIGVLGYVLNGFVAADPQLTGQIEGRLNQRGLDSPPPPRTNA